MLKCQLNFLMTIEIFLTETACEGLKFDAVNVLLLHSLMNLKITQKKSTSTIVANANNCIESVTNTNSPENTKVLVVYSFCNLESKDR